MYLCISILFSIYVCKTMAEPLKNLHNLGQTCWCASAVQALRSVPVFGAQFAKQTTLLGAVLRAAAIDDKTLKRLYRASQKILNAPGGSPEDPAEFLVTLFDQEKICCKSFESARTLVKKCTVCGHTRTETSSECMMIIPRIEMCASPLQRALDTEFGFKVPPLAPKERQGVSAEKARDSPFAGPSLGVVPGEKWWKCDDNAVSVVALTSAAPYLLFYRDRSKLSEGEVPTFEEKHSEEDVDSDDIANLLPSVSQTRELDCEGSCKGQKTTHKVFVGVYEASRALIVHVQCPQHMPLDHIERTLFASEEEDDEAAFDLVAMVCRVGFTHYVCYRRIM